MNTFTFFFFTAFASAELHFLVHYHLVVLVQEKNKTGTHSYEICSTVRLEVEKLHS